MNYDKLYREDLLALLMSTWGISRKQILWVTQLNDVNLQERITSEDIATPFVAIQVNKRQPEVIYGDIDTYRYPTDIYLIFKTQTEETLIDPGQPSLGYDKTAYAETQGSLLRDALLGFIGAGFQPFGDQPQIDSSDANPANAVIYQLGRPLFAVQVSCSPLIGLPTFDA